MKCRHIPSFASSTQFCHYSLFMMAAIASTLRRWLFSRCRPCTSCRRFMDTWWACRWYQQTRRHHTPPAYCRVSSLVRRKNPHHLWLFATFRTRIIELLVSLMRAHVDVYVVEHFSSIAMRMVLITRVPMSKYCMYSRCRSWLTCSEWWTGSTRTCCTLTSIFRIAV